MSSLPSFVELMESLGLSSDNESAGRTKSHSRGSSFSSSASSSSSSLSSPPPLTVPNHSYQYPSAEKNNSSPGNFIYKCNDMLDHQDTGIGRRSSLSSLRAARFAPYSPQPRRRSLSNMSNGSSIIFEDKSESWLLTHSCAPSRSCVVDSYSKACPKVDAQSKVSSETSTCTSISTFARRHSPQTSPTSASFSQRHRNVAFIAPTPVALPTLPPLLAQSSPFSLFSPQSVSADSMHSDESSPLINPFSKHHQYHFQAGVRISSPFRSHTQYPRHQKVAPVA